MSDKSVALLVVDGGSKGNPGSIYLAYYYNVTIGSEEYSRGPAIVTTDITGTNNQAEYQAMLLGIRKVVDWLYETDRSSEDIYLVILSDSQLAVNQLNGIYNTKSEKLQQLKARVLQSLDGFGNYVIRWVPRYVVNAYLGC